ncbi:cyclophilin-like fold protein [Mycolicibacterium hodleri]|uniref:cyclophilin-like fold protein n=1 Tax=Mycolicibacterium hodleri TaxID=49897 RepID=UPI00163D1313|nr:cyclophilin-like fold protein [Mycolicibacterium hodleri]
MTACSGAQTPGAKAADDTASTAETAFRIVVGDTVLTGHLFDNTAARDLAAQLPLTVTFRDLNAAEKTAPLPRKLAVDGMPAGEDPRVGDLGYWAPDGDLVVYYGDVGYWTGIMRLGEIDGGLQSIARQSGDFSATVELAG